MTFSPESKMQWVMFSALIIIGVAFLLYLTRSVLNLQYLLLYYPSTTEPPEALLRTNNIKLWRVSGSDYRGLVTADQPKAGKGTVVVFHGNGGTAADRSFYMDELCPLGYRVVLAEYPLYGGRKGELGEKSYVDDGSETVRLAFEDFGGPLFLLGESMGAGVAAAIVAKTSVKIAGIILITPWDTLSSIAKETFPFLPVRLLLKDNYDSIGNLRSFQGRIAVLGAGLDEVIPIGHARNLYDSLSGTARKMWLFQEAAHNDWYRYANKEWWKEVMDFTNGSN